MLSCRCLTASWKSKPEDGSRTVSEMKTGIPYFREAGVEHDVINANDFECAFVEIELMN